MTEDRIIDRLRLWMNEGPGRWVTTAIALCVVVAVAWAVIKHTSSNEPPGATEVRQRGRRATYICQECGASGKVKVAFSAKPPHECPKCGAVSALAAHPCRNCERIIEARPEPVYDCPHCGAMYDNRLNGD